MADETFPYREIRIYAGVLELPTPDGETYLRHREQQKLDTDDGNTILAMLTPEHAVEMADLAAKCLDNGEFQRGIQAIALALAVDPANSAWREILEHYLDHVEKGESPLLPKRAFPWFLFNPIRVYLARRRNDLEKQLAYVTGVVQSFPAREYLEYWVLPWLDRATLNRQNPKEVLHVFSVLLERYPEYDQLSARQAENLQFAVSRMRLFEEVHGSDAKLLVLKLMALGKLGRLRDAIEEGKTAHSANPSWNSAIAVANALKRAGAVAEAIKYFREGADLDTTDVSALMEIGDLYLAQKEWTAALEAYEQALARIAGHPWADPSAAFCRYRLRGERSELDRLRRMAQSTGDPCGARDVLAALGGDTPPSARQHRARSLLFMLKESTL